MTATGLPELLVAMVRCVMILATGAPVMRFAPVHVMRVFCHCLFPPYFENDFGLAEGILTPACLAFDNRIALRCFSARSAPNLRRVAFTIAGGFAFIS